MCPYDLAAHVRERRREPGHDERYADPEGGHPQRRDRAALAASVRARSAWASRATNGGSSWSGSKTPLPT